MRIQWWWDATFTGSKSSNQMFSSSSGTTGNYEWCTKGSFGRSPAPRAIHSCKPNPAIYLQGNTTTRCTWCYISIAIYTNNTNCIHYTVLIVFHDWLCEHLLYISNILRFSAYNEMDTGQVDRWSIEALFAENIVQNHYHLSISLHKTHTRM